MCLILLCRKLVYAVLSPSPTSLKYLSYHRTSPTYKHIRDSLNLYPLVRRAHSLLAKVPQTDDNNNNNDKTVKGEDNEAMEPIEV